MCQQICGTTVSTTIACSLQNAKFFGKGFQPIYVSFENFPTIYCSILNSDTNRPYCAVYMGLKNRTTADSSCKSMNAKLPLPRSKSDLVTFQVTFEKMVPENDLSASFLVYLDMVDESKTGIVYQLVVRFMKLFSIDGLAV